MEIYDTDEEQVAALKRWWKANGPSVITGLIIGIVLIVGWNLWKSYKHDQVLAASGLYEQLLDAEEAGKTESMQKISEVLIDKYGSTPYATYAALFQVKGKVNQKTLDDAKATLEKLMTATDDEMNNVARIRLVRLLLSTGNHEQGLQLIAEVDAANSQGFMAQYEELTGDLYVALERYGEARTAYQNALRLGATSPLIQFKLDDISAPELDSE